jgi:hypothetical protein
MLCLSFVISCCNKRKNQESIMIIKQQSSRQAAVFKGMCWWWMYRFKRSFTNGGWCFVVRLFCLLTSMTSYTGCFFFSKYIFMLVLWFCKTEQAAFLMSWHPADHHVEVLIYRGNFTLMHMALLLGVRNLCLNCPKSVL